MPLCRALYALVLPGTLRLCASRYVDFRVRIFPSNPDPRFYAPVPLSTTDARMIVFLMGLLLYILRPCASHQAEFPERGFLHAPKAPNLGQSDGFIQYYGILQHSPVEILRQYVLEYDPGIVHLFLPEA